MKYIVGKPKMKLAFLNIILSIALAIVLYVFSPWQGMNFVCIVIILVSIFIVLPGEAYCELMWKVDNQTIQYTHHETLIQKQAAFFRHLFVTHRLEYQMTINIDQIDYIVVTYAKVPRPPYGAYGYDVWFNVHMYDGSIYSFISLTLSGRKDFNQAVDYLKEQGIHFKDGYHILDALHTKEPLPYYLERLEKEQSK